MTRWTTLPIRWRLTAAFAAAMALLISGLSGFVYARTGADLLAEVDAGLRSRAELLVTDVQEQGPGLTGVRPTLIESDEVFAQIATATGRITQSSPLIAGQRLLPPGQVRQVRRPLWTERRIPGIDNVARILAVPVRVPGGRVVVIAGASLQDRQDALASLAATLAVAGAGALVLVSLAAWLVLARALRPVERMRQQAAGITAVTGPGPGPRLTQPAGRDEIALLGRTLNEMLGRIEESVDRERRLIDRASHELRTPLAIQRIDLDLALSGPATAAALTSALRSVSEENEHLTRLTEDLLVLSRSRNGTLPVRRARTSLADLADDARLRASATAPPGTRLAVTAEDTVVLVDPAWFRQAIGNLVDNALRHTPPGGEVGVRLSADDGTVLLTVEDTGPGFGADLASRVFEPFAAPGAPGSRPGVAGLGLAVVQAIAAAHGGRAWAENRPEGGARVSMTARDGLSPETGQPG
jgi:two-component system OmpR family sensor kinase